MKKIHLKIFILLTVLIFGNACSLIKPSVKADLSKTPYAELLWIHADWQASIRSMQANTRITLDTPQFSGNFFADIFLEEPDSLLVTVQGAFGMHLGKVFIAHHRFIFYNQIAISFLKVIKVILPGATFYNFPWKSAVWAICLLPMMLLMF
jgi:hypothetical protein